MVGKSRPEIVRNIGEPSTSWQDAKTGGEVLVYTAAAVIRGNGESPVFPRATVPTVYRKSKLLYLDKNGVCYSWKKF